VYGSTILATRRFEEVVRQHQDRVFSYACYALGSREEAKDIAQEVFIRLWDHWTELDQDAITGWIIKVARNACVDKLRQRQTRAALLQEHFDTDERYQPPADDFDDRSGLRAQIEAAIHELDEPYKTIVILREIDELAYDQIASALTMPLNTVKVYLHRARRMLREKLKGVNESA
jgi:RNA polymerase sigma-70 factor (ECF subfamily)